MSVTLPLGFRAAAATAGIKPSGKPDLALIVRDAVPGCAPASAASFTRNAIVGAPIEIARAQRARILAGAAAPQRAILINAGNSNSATGEKGLADARATMAAVASALSSSPPACTPDDVTPSSTGVIGRLLPVDKITRAIPALAAALARGPAADAAAAAAIMTTDLVPKTASRELDLDGFRVRLGAIAKGSGMIAPRLDSAFAPPTPAATMLAFLTTDAAIASPDLQRLLEAAAGQSFDRISVDNHPSCSDTLLCLASGAAEASRPASGSMPPLKPGSPAFAAFAAALQSLCEDLATQIVVDGEGATRTFRVTVRGAASTAHAEAMAREIVNSPLVKCAIHGRDPNWGRIVTAAGNAGIPFNPAEASLLIGPPSAAVEVYRAGVPIPGALDDPRLAQAMSAKQVDCDLTVGRGPALAWMIGCDLSAKYVSINADYTT